MSRYNPFKRTSDDSQEARDPESRVSFLPQHDRSSGEDDDNTTSPVIEKDAYSHYRKPLYKRHSSALLIHLPLFVGNILLTVFLILSWSKGNREQNLVPCMLL